MRLDYQRLSVGVDHGVVLATLHFLARIITARSAGLAGLDTLAVDHRRRRGSLVSGPLAVVHDEMVVDGLEQALAAKALEPAIDRISWREVLGRHALGSAGPQHVEDGVHDLAHRPFAGTAGPRRRRHERGKDRPFRISQIASITQVIAAMLPPGGWCPHEALQTGFDNCLESHLNPAIHPKTQFQDSL